MHKEYETTLRIQPQDLARNHYESKIDHISDTEPTSYRERTEQTRVNLTGEHAFTTSHRIVKQIWSKHGNTRS